MQIGLLGSVEVRDDAGAIVDVGGRQPRLVLALLLLQPGRSVSVDVLADSIWAGSPPPSAVSTMQSYVSRLRRQLAPFDVALRFDETGYSIDVDPDIVDAHRFERLAGEAHRLVDADPERAATLAEDALALWRGPALADFADVDAARGAATRWDELRIVTLEDRFEAELALGHHQLVAAELVQAAAQHPFREGLHVKLGLALYRSGRQAEALRAVAAASARLRDELGIEPGRELRAIEQAILEQDPALDPPSTSMSTSTSTSASTSTRPVPVADDVSTARTADGAPVATMPWRDAELRELVAAWDEARREARFVLVEGEPGIGKSYLVEQLRRAIEAAGAMAVWGRCDESGASPALWPWLAPVRAAAERAGDDGGVLEILSSAPGEHVELFGAVEPRQLFGRIGDLLAGAADGTSAAAVLIDDLQWADAASLDLLADLALRRPPGLLIVATMRQLEVGRADRLVDTLATLARTPGSRRLSLRGLSLQATTQLLDQVAPLGAALAAAVHRRAEGNPFYAIELARLAQDEAATPDALPATVRDVVRRRLGTLPPATASLLSVAAICGRDVDLSLLAPAAVMEPDDCLDALDPAVAHRVLVMGDDRPDVLRFSHAIVREVLVEDMTPLRRARLQVRVADAMEARGVGADDAEILAELLWQSTPAGTGRRAAGALRRAAEVALARGAYTSAASMLRRAGDLLQRSGNDGDLPERLACAVRELEVSQARLAFGGIDPATFERVRALATRAGDRDVLRSLDWYDWSIPATGNRLDEARRRGMASFEELVADPRPFVRREAYEMRTVIHWSDGEIVLAAECADIARDLGTAHPETPATQAEQYRRLLGDTFFLLVHALRGDIDIDDISQRFDALIAAAPNSFVASTAIGFAETVAATFGRDDDLQRWNMAGSAVPGGSEHRFPYTQHEICGLVVRAGELPPDQLLREFGEARARYIEIGARAALTVYGAQLAIALLRSQRGADAIAAATTLTVEARRELDEWHERWTEPVVLLAEAWVAAATGRHGDAAAKLDEAEQLARAQGADGLARRIVAERAAVGDAAAEHAIVRPPCG